MTQKLVPTWNQQRLSAGKVPMRYQESPDTCCARVSSFDRSERGYQWCELTAHWKRQDQWLCDFHAGMLVAGTDIFGITECGHWGHTYNGGCIPDGLAR